MTIRDPRWRTRCALLLAALLLAVTGCRVKSLPLWGPAPPAADACAVETIRDVPYCDGPKADTCRHTLDLYLPRGQKDFPVVVLVHGGAWMIGDNRCCGLYSSVGEFLASRGVGVVMPNYRLSPPARHPDHVRDVARAVAWTRAHIAEHGGCPRHLFLAGHSAGGHLVALLGTDESYLKAEGLCAADIRGVIAVSGVYRIPLRPVEVTLGGADPDAFHFDEIFPLRAESTRSAACCAAGVAMQLDVYRPAFGGDAEVREAASPVCHVRPGLPPFLLLTAEMDLTTLPGMAVEFHEVLCAYGNEAQLLRIERRNHNSVLFRVIETGDPAARAILAFIRRHAGGE